ncbi:MAG: hypothetical protein KKI02_12510 [Planctomycetes bacterium]|nr:hypothetical protein [Planctomycetota bacterium]
MRRVPLFTDKDAARAELNRLVKQAERERAGFADPSERRAREPIQTHIRDYKAYLISKSVSPSHLNQVMSRLQVMVERCRFATLADIQAAAVVRQLNAMKQQGKGAKTRNTYAATLHSLIRWAKAEGRIPADPHKMP